MRRTPLRVTAAVSLAVLFIGSTATSGFAAEGVTTPTPVDGTPGHYIVLMKADPLASYDGGTAGFKATKPAKGDKLDAHSANSQKYIAHLRNEQRKLAAEQGVTPDADYQVVANGFSAQLTGAQVDKLRASKDVLGVYADEVRHPQAQTSTDFLGLGDDAAGKGGVWERTGGVGTAGEGIVVGVVGGLGRGVGAPVRKVQVDHPGIPALNLAGRPAHHLDAGEPGLGGERENLVERPFREDRRHEPEPHGRLPFRSNQADSTSSHPPEAADRAIASHKRTSRCPSAKLGNGRSPVPPSPTQA